MARLSYCMGGMAGMGEGHGRIAPWIRQCWGSMFASHISVHVVQTSTLGANAWSCKHAAGRIQRHHALNDIIARALTAAGIPVSKEPWGLFQNDVRRPDGITFVPWQAGKAVAWDVTVASTLADSYVK